MIGVVKTGYTLKVKNFEGPLELLLELIHDAKMDITDISLSNITDQYLLYIKTIQLFNIDVASEFFVIAASLVYMKTRRLLPGAKAEEEEILDEKELIERLKEYRKYRYMARELWKLKEAGDVYYSRGSTSRRLFAGRDTGSDGLLVGDLIQALWRYRGAFIKKPIPIKRREINVEAKMEFILNLLAREKMVRFSQVISADGSKVERVASFLGSLELSFRQKVLLQQLKLFHDIDIKLKEAAPALI